MTKLPAGPIPGGLNLQLAHDLSVNGGIGAGTLVGFQTGFTVGYDSRGVPPPSAPPGGVRRGSPMTLKRA